MLKPCVSFPGYSADEAGNVVGPSGRVLRGKIDHQGYKRVHISISGKSRWITASRLVCDAFYGPHPPDKPNALHGTLGREINAPHNLRWGSDADNYKDRIVFGEGLPIKRGEKHPAAILTDVQVTELRGLKGRLPQREIAKIFGISQSQVSRILSGNFRQ